MLKLGKGWRKWLMVGFLIIIGALAVLAFATGCSGDKKATTTTPLQALQADVDAVEARLDTLDDTVWQNGNGVSSLGTRTTNIETWKTSVDEKITNLETGGMFIDSLGNITARVAFLELQWQTLANSSTLTPTATPTATLSPTPTPTPTVICAVTKPSNPFPADGVTNVSENNIELRWSDCGAVNYLLYVGVNSSTTLTQIANITTPRYYYNGLLPNTYYCWKVIAVAPLGCPDGTTTWSFRTSSW